MLSQERIPVVISSPSLRDTPFTTESLAYQLRRLPVAIERSTTPLAKIVFFP